MTTDQISSSEAQKRIVRYTVNPVSFIEECVKILDATLGEWIPFFLWEEQEEAILTFKNNKLVIILKARQLGASWLVLSYALWRMIFRPAAEILIFSRRETEAVYLLKDRLKEMYKRLPDYIKQSYYIETDNDNEWSLSNGSKARAFSPTSGDSYTATLAIVDEADIIQGFRKLMVSVKPTIDGGGGMIILSRSNKKKPGSHFKAMYRAAKAGLNNWVALFWPWWIRPTRDQAWYDEKVQDAQASVGSLDDVFEQYPSTDTEALKPGTLDKRINSDWIEKCYEPLNPKDIRNAPALPASAIFYKKPKPGRQYVIGADTAEGLPTSDDSPFHVLDVITGEEVFKLGGQMDPSTQAGYIDLVGNFYNEASVLVERNNHGHAVLLWLKDNSNLVILKGRDKRIGWQTNSLSKSLMYDHAAEMFRDEDTILRSFSTYTQLSSVEKSTLNAPEGSMDDEAISYCLALMARKLTYRKKEIRKPSSYEG